MFEKDREKREPFLFPPSEAERWLQERREDRRLRQKRYFARKRELKRQLEVIYVKAS